MKKPNDEILERILKDGAKNKNDDDDVIIYSVKHKDKERTLSEKSREIEFKEDPDQGVIPISVRHIKYHTDDNGRPFSKGKAGFCRFDCCVVLESLLTCSHCHQNICKQHSIRSGSKVFCKEGLCLIIGRLSQIFRTIFKILKYCVSSITGIEFQNEEEHIPEREILEKDEEGE